MPTAVRAAIEKKQNREANFRNLVEAAVKRGQPQEKGTPTRVGNRVPTKAVAPAAAPVGAPALASVFRRLSLRGRTSNMAAAAPMSDDTSGISKAPPASSSTRPPAPAEESTVLSGAKIQPWCPIPPPSARGAQGEEGVSGKSEAMPRQEGARVVRDLRPSPAVVVDGDLSVTAAALTMAQHRVDAVLVVSAESGALQGILTDTDVTRKVLAAGGEPERTTVSSVMSDKPT